MQLNLETSNAKYQIKSYTPGHIVINDESYSSSILLTPSYLALWQAGNIEQILTLKPAIILWGCGEYSKPIDLQISNMLNKQNIGIEVMTTAAACRTFTILAAEQRNVLAALII